MPKYAMVIDLHRCTGCGACILGCKVENNLDEKVFWAHHIKVLEGTFPDLEYTYIPTLCNHCDNAPCVEVCPVEPKAMHKVENGMTMHNLSRCIGCRLCEENCPYGVIHYNAEEPHAFWRDDTPLIPNCTSTPVETTQKVDSKVLPYYNPDRDYYTYQAIREKNKVEKCTFCDHRVERGMQPYCNEVCPCEARFFGDLEDPDSTVSKLLKEYPHQRLKEDLETEPRVYYIRNYKPQKPNREG